MSPQNPAIADAGAAQTFTATGHYNDGSTQDLTSSATWSSSNTGAASIDSTGHATSAALPGGQSAGFTSIKAVMSGVTGVSILSVTSHTGNGFAGVFTQHNDIGRTGQNLNETILTPAAVSTPASFGKKFSQPVDGFIYAQPLYVPNVAISGKGTHNVVYVATENDSVYAFDAETNSGANANPLWHANLLDTAHGGASGASAVTSGSGGGVDIGCTDLVPQLGVTSTPVIDPSTGTMYVEAKSKESGNFVHRLHALDITTGNEKASSPVVVSGSTFDALQHNNRPGLLLLNGMLYLAYASHCDSTPYHGWIFAYDAATLSQKAIFNESPNGRMGGFWMSGAGIAADSNGNIYIVSGNGNFDTGHVPATDLGDTILKLFFDGTTLSLADYFTPFNQDSLNGGDIDLGSGGVLLLPDQPGSHAHELVQAGKEGTIYVADRDQLTSGNKHYCSSNCNGTDAQIVQEIQSQIGGMWSSPAYWNNTVYFWASGDVLQAFSLSSGRLATPSTAATHGLSFPGATPSISAHGTTNGVVWAIDSTDYGFPNTLSPGPAVLYAYDASNVSTPLYSSTLVADTAGAAVKFAVPTIANGKVYVGTQTELDVYGLLP
ncbi:MAG: PQQ-binding-like beta-propeller repeat protein [Acidobacteriia bacterium]|nr:PQQ-binding-like beta-propeller repeat protein [Terriglobia bacterium]